MIDFRNCKNIYVYSEFIDMRFGMKKLQFLVGVNFTNSEIRNSVFIFCSSKENQIKIYYEDDYGSWLLQNKLHDGKFKWPKLTNNKTITKQQLIGLCKGLEVIESDRPQAKEYSYY